MKQKFQSSQVKELYLPPACECTEVSLEGVLCSSNIQASDGAFGAEDDVFVGEWNLFG